MATTTAKIVSGGEKGDAAKRGEAGINPILAKGDRHFSKARIQRVHNKF